MLVSPLYYSQLFTCCFTVKAVNGDVAVAIAIVPLVRLSLLEYCCHIVEMRFVCRSDPESYAAGRATHALQVCGDNEATPEELLQNHEGGKDTHRFMAAVKRKKADSSILVLSCLPLCL
jgi:hypothetical protein